MKKDLIIRSRLVATAIITLIYILATFLAVLTYNALSYSLWINLLIADIVATVVVFAGSLIFDNSSVYDPYWSVQPIIILWFLAFNSGLNLVSLLILAVVSIWGVRLTANWVYTFHGFSYQDWRYVMLKENTGVFYPLINFIGIHLVPTLVVYFCTLPAVFVITSNAQFSFLCLIPLALSLFATAMQGISDIQMHSFRASKVGGFIRKGFWKYSRHPNYLGEILMWWGVAFASISLLGFNWYLLLGALLNTLLFVFVSIPMAEKRQSRKPGFNEYKDQTHLLLPISLGLSKKQKN